MAQFQGGDPWKLFKVLAGTHKPRTSARGESNHAKNFTQAQALRESYLTIATPDVDIPAAPIPNSSDDAALSVNDQTIHDAIRRTRDNAGRGPDNISGRCLKVAWKIEAGRTCISFLVNESLRTGVFPT